jgi:hypothetical protein
MVIIRECDEMGREFFPTDPEEKSKSKLMNDHLKHVTRPNGSIDWEAFELGYFSHRIIEELSSDNDSSSGDSYDNTDIDCVFLYSTPGNTRRGDIFVYLPPLVARRKEVFLLVSASVSEMDVFAYDVRRCESSYTEKVEINFLRGKLVVSFTGREADIIMAPCSPGEKVCIQHPKGVKEIFHTYVVVLEEFGVKISFTSFEMDVLKFLNVAPLQIQPNSWAFIWSFEVFL